MIPLPLEILKAIRSCDPVGMNRTALLDSLYIANRRESRDEIDSVLNELKDREHITVVADPDASGHYRYFIAPAGKARLAQQRL